MTNIEEKALHFIAALADVYQDEDNRELEAFSKLEMTDDATEDITAMLVAMQFVCQLLTGYDGDLIDFTHVLNKLAVQHIMEDREDVKQLHPRAGLRQVQGHRRPGGQV